MARMKRTYLITFATVITASLLAGCSDPADKVHKSDASAPKDTAATTAASKTFVVRPESKIGFVGSKVTGSHEGGFTNFSGTVSLADGKVVAPTEIKITMASTWSDAEKLTGHLKSPDFFDTEKFPTSTFMLTSVEPATDGSSKVTGNLALHGVTNSISFPAKIEVAEASLTVKAEFAINRKDFAINYPGKADDLIRDNVVIKLDLSAAPGEARP